MKKIIIALAATTAIAAAAPAAAQYAGGNIQLRTDQLQTQLQAGVQSGAITRTEAMPLREQLRQLTRLERQYSQGGFSLQERSELQSRMASLRQGIRMAARNGDGRYDRDDRYGDGRDGRYDRDDRYGDGRFGRDCPPGLDKRDNGCLPPGQVGRDDRDGRWGEDGYARGDMMDRNRDGYDDRDLNRDRRIDDREWRMAEERYGDNGRFDRDGDRYDRDDDRDTRRGGIGGIVDSMLGRDGLRVGQQASGTLYGLQGGYRDQYRDGDGSYYRTDGRQIYQIDARSQTVVRIYPMSR